MDNPKEEQTRFREALGRRVMSRRRELGLDQFSLAKKAGASLGVISRLERGRQTVSIERFYQIAYSLDTTPDVLLGLREEERVLS